MFRLLGLNEEGEPLEHEDADTFVLQLQDDFYSDVLKVQLEMNAMRHFYSGPDVGELKTHAGRSLGSPDKAQKNGWDIDLKSLEQKCNSIPDKGKKSVIVVPIDSFYSYQNISIDKSIPSRYATAIARARKNGHTILVTTKKPLSAHKLFFGTTGFYKQIFGNDTLTDSAPNVIAFSPQQCEIDRVHQIAILDLLYLASVREIQEEIVLAPLREADGMELFVDRQKSSAAIEQKLSEIQNRVKFLKELSLILSLRPEGIHSIPPLQGPSELQQLSDILKKDGFSWNRNVMNFLSSNLKIKVNSDILLQKLWQQFCLFSYEGGVENAMERANQRYNRADVSSQDSLALGFDYFLAKLIHREGWGMPDISSLTPWSPTDLEAFETQNAGNEILDVSFGEHLFPNPGPYKDEKTGAMIYKPADLIRPLR